MPQAVASDGGLWVGEARTVVEVVGPAGVRRLEIPAQRVEDLAVDATRGVVWVATRWAVVQYTLDGQDLFRYRLNLGPRPPGKEDERSVHLSLSPSDGAIWVGAEDRVVKLGFDQRVLLTIEGIGRIVDVSVDIADGSCWVGFGNRAAKQWAACRRRSRVARSRPPSR